ncbi:hypothetical protein [Sphingomonas sp. BK580]|uniref:hypothetical protein n=1 Tax=Sphingomonas sp. BK580 TaxID=2586972 RepID=UPI001608C64C|nr:hypothetical protein [Sphingomonas sp. BK580]MBB3692492.1 hypothetical protein [Sphingomonas sp. BK580]
MVVRVIENSGEGGLPQVELKARPVVGDEHLQAFGSPAALSILRDMCLEAAQEGRASADESIAAAVVYARLAAAVGGAAEALALGTLLLDRAIEAAQHGASEPATLYLQEAAARFGHAAKCGITEAAERYVDVLRDPAFTPPDDDTARLLVAIEGLHHDAANGDDGAIAVMVRGCLNGGEVCRARRLVEAEQYARLGAASGTPGSALRLVDVLFVRATDPCNAHETAEVRSWWVVEAISIAHEWSSVGDATATVECLRMVDELPADVRALAATAFPPTLTYVEPEGSC